MSTRLLAAAALLVALALLVAACDSGFTETATTAEGDDLAGKPEKVALCHADGEYDQVVLIIVAEPALMGHLDNDDHCTSEEVCDYELLGPTDPTATGDVDGNGTVDACEIVCLDGNNLGVTLDQFCESRRPDIAYSSDCQDACLQRNVCGYSSPQYAGWCVND